MSWNKLENSAERGPISLGARLIWIFFALAIIGGAFAFVGSFLGGAADVAQELNPREVQAKYEWFKEASAKLDALHANVAANTARKTSIEKRYTKDGITKDPTEWTRADQDAIVQIDAETAGIKMAYNRLAADYNAAMAKWNFRFANQGDLPKGADRALPRDYRPYTE